MRKEWQLHALGDVCKMGSGGTPLTSKREYYNGGTIPWLQSGEVAQGEIRIATNFITQAGFENSAARIFPPDTVLVAMYGATAGQVGILRFEASTNQAICGIFPNERFHPKFLYYALLSKKNELISRAVGNAQPNISQVKIKNTYVPVPPLAEQKRIVAILDKAFEGIDTATANANKNLANAREMFDSYLNSVFAHQDEGWTKKKLEDTVQKTCSLSYGIVQPGEDVDDGLPIVRPTDLRSKIICLDGLKRITPALADGYKRTELQGGELLLCVRGGTGSVSIAAGELAGSNVTRGIVPIRFDPTVVIQEFGYFIFISKNIQDQIRAATYGAALMQINIRDLRKVCLPLPPLDVQENLLSVFNNISTEVERLASIYEQKAAALAELKESVLQKAFAGNLNLKSADAMREAAE